MRGWLLDTNVISELRRPRPDSRVIDWVRSQPRERTHISILTIAELEQGIEALQLDDPRRAPLARFLRHIEANFVGRVLTLDDQAVRLWGSLSGEYRHVLGGRPPVIDAMLLAQARTQRLYLATRNVRDLGAFGGPVFNPWEDDPADFPLEL